MNILGLMDLKAHPRKKPLSHGRNKNMMFLIVWTITYLRLKGQRQLGVHMHIMVFFCISSKVGLCVHKVVCTWLTTWFDTGWGIPIAWSGWRSVFVKVVCRCAHWSSHQLILIYVVCWLLTHGSLDISIVCWALFRINLILKDKEVWWLCVRSSSVWDICVWRSASRRIPHWTWLI